MATRNPDRPAMSRAANESLGAGELLDLLYWMRLTRALDERCELLFKQGKVPGAVFSQLGHEAIAVGAAHALEEGDVVGPMHRDLGAFLVRGMAPGRILAQVLGRIGGPSRGRDVNTHGLGDLSLGILGYVSHLPQLMAVTLGAGFALAYRGLDRVALTYFGDGAFSEGGAHETLNLAAVLGAPVVFVLENNQYAYSTPLEHQCRVEDLALRAQGYGIPASIVDGNDVLAVRSAACEAIARARRGDGPTLIECKTLRMRGHAIHDPADYVPRELLEEWAARDPIRRFEARLSERGVLDASQGAAIDARIARELDEAVAWAEASPWPDPAALTSGVYA
jgi:pyruvate dehydrogenase E1 component alpha subunit